MDYTHLHNEMMNKHLAAQKEAQRQAAARQAALRALQQQQQITTSAPKPINAQWPISLANKALQESGVRQPTRQLPASYPFANSPVQYGQEVPETTVSPNGATADDPIYYGGELPEVTVTSNRVKNTGGIQQFSDGGKTDKNAMYYNGYPITSRALNYANYF